jgi:hypothetical protein
MLGCRDAGCNPPDEIFRVVTSSDFVDPAYLPVRHSSASCRAGKQRTGIFQKQVLRGVERSRPDDRLTAVERARAPVR